MIGLGIGLLAGDILLMLLEMRVRGELLQPEGSRSVESAARGAARSCRDDEQSQWRPRAQW